MFVAAILQTFNASIESASILARMIVALLSFAAAGQTSLAVTVGLAELNTSMVTGTIVSRLPISEWIDELRQKSGGGAE